MDTDNIPESRTQKKKQAEALQDFGRQLCQLAPNQLATIPCPEHLLKAIQEHNKIKSHGGLRRQMQYIGKLLRSVDIEPLELAYLAICEQKSAADADFHCIERWRDRLLAEGKPAITDFIRDYPQTNSQQLRQQVKKAQLEPVDKKAAKRQLFQTIKEILSAS